MNRIENYLIKFLETRAGSEARDLVLDLISGKGLIQTALVAGEAVGVWCLFAAGNFVFDRFWALNSCVFECFKGNEGNCCLFVFFPYPRFLFFVLVILSAGWLNGKMHKNSFRYSAMLSAFLAVSMGPYLLLKGLSFLLALFALAAVFFLMFIGWRLSSK